MTTHIIIFVLSFIGIWLGSGVVVKSVEKLARILSLSSFSVSFLLLGIFTSVGEISVGINSVIRGDPEIYVGNLIGGSMILFMLVIPLLAILGHSINVPAEFRSRNLPLSLFVVGLPVLTAIDGKIGKIDSLILLISFVLLIINVEKQKDLAEKIKSINSYSASKIFIDIISIILGVSVIFVYSKFVVDQTLFFSKLLNISPFVISLLVVSIGTNIPELSLVIRSALMKNKQVAFGDFIGSAVFNTFLVGLLTLIYGKTVLLTNSFLVSLLFLVATLAMFYIFAKSKHSISRTEAFALLILYGLFISTELSLHQKLLNWFIK